jgi:hypothetical protein
MKQRKKREGNIGVSRTQLYSIEGEEKEEWREEQIVHRIFLQTQSGFKSTKIRVR